LWVQRVPLDVQVNFTVKEGKLPLGMRLNQTNMSYGPVNDHSVGVLFEITHGSLIYARLLKLRQLR